MKKIVAEFETNHQKVADFLKVVINQMFEAGAEPYPDVKEANPTLFDLSGAIHILEKQKTTKLTIVDDEEE